MFALIAQFVTQVLHPAGFKSAMAAYGDNRIATAKSIHVDVTTSGNTNTTNWKHWSKHLTKKYDPATWTP